MRLSQQLHEGGKRQILDTHPVQLHEGSQLIDLRGREIRSSLTWKNDDEMAELCRYRQRREGDDSIRRQQRESELDQLRETADDHQSRVDRRSISGCRPEGHV